MNIDEEKLNKLSKDYENKVVATLDVMPLMIGDGALLLRRVCVGR